MKSNTFNSRMSSKTCSGTVYHDNTVKRPQNICPVCGETFLFQLQLRVHLETHENDEEDNSAENGDEIQMETDTNFESKELNKVQSNSVNSFSGSHENEMNIEHTNGLNNDINEMEVNIPNSVNGKNDTVIDKGFSVKSVAVLEENSSTDYEIFVNQITDSDEDTENDEVLNHDDSNMNIDFGTVEEVNKSTVIENDVNLDEVINEIRKGEEKQDQDGSLNVNESATQTLTEPETEVIVLNKDMKLSRKPDASKLRYECDICEEKFQWPFQLKRHTNIHNGLYPYECEKCGRKFDRVSIVKMHTNKKTDIWKNKAVMILKFEQCDFAINVSK